MKDVIKTFQVFAWVLFGIGPILLDVLFFHGVKSQERSLSMIDAAFMPDALILIFLLVYSRVKEESK